MELSGVRVGGGERVRLVGMGGEGWAGKGAQARGEGVGEEVEGRRGARLRAVSTGMPGWRMNACCGGWGERGDSPAACVR